MTSYDHVRIEDHGPVRLVTLHRPEKKNAFNVPLGLELWRAIEEADADAKVRALAVTGSGDYFSGGVDLNVFMNMGSIDPQDLMRLARIYEPLRACKKPTMAIVQGHAVGMGVTMLPHFDLVYAADHVTFMTPFVKLGLVLEYGSAYTLSRLIGPSRAKEFILRAAPLDAKTAAEWGMVTRVFDREGLHAQAMAIAGEIAEQPPGAVAECKRLIELGLAQPIEAMFEAEHASLAARYGSPENLEAVMKFMTRKRG